MSWVDKIKTGIVITTGDGKIYEPLYMITSKTVAYNIAEFEFPNIIGTLVNRGTAKGARFNIELIFQGEDHLDKFKAFEKSNNDSRPWKVSHPLYDDLLLQPISLTYDPTGLNTTKITGELVETITDEYPKVGIDVKDKINFDAINTNQVIEDYFSSNVIPTNKDVAQMQADTFALYNEGIKSVKSTSQANEYLQKFKTAKSKIATAVSKVTPAVNAMNSLINAPFQFENNIKGKITLIQNQYNTLADKINTLTTPNSKKVFQNNSSMLMTTLVQSIANPLSSDFNSSADVFDVIKPILNLWSNHITNLDFLTTSNGGTINSFIPNATILNSLSSLINLSISQLFAISLTTKQERVLYLEADSNPIILTHRFFGIDDEGTLIDKFMLSNQIGLNELLQIKKGRKIIYYV